MPWSDDIRCLYCDGRLPLYRKITNGQFCSSAHRKAYWQEQERLAVERLNQTHDSLRAYRPAAPQDIESILGHVPPAEPENAELLAPAQAAADTRPWWMPLVNMGQLPMGAFVRNRATAQPRWPRDGIAGQDAQPVFCLKNVRRPFNLYAPFDCGFEFAGAVTPALTPAKAAQRLLEAAPIDVVVSPVARVAWQLQPVFEPIEIVQEEIPPFAGLRALGWPGPREQWRRAAEAVALEIAVCAQLPLNQVVPRVALMAAEALRAGLRQLPIALVPEVRIDPLRALDLRVELDSPRFTMSTPPGRARLRLAAGRRYAVAMRANPLVALAHSGALPPAMPAVALPQRSVKPLRAAPTVSPLPRIAAEKEPQAAGLLALRLNEPATLAAAAVRPAPQTFSDPQTPRPEPLRPRARLEPLSPPPVPEAAAIPAVVAAQEPGARELPPPVSHVQHLAGFWNHAPRDLKILGVAVPLLLALALHPGLPKVPVAPPAKAVALRKDVEKAWNEQMVSVKQSVTDRAAVALDEDFRAGLDDWVSRGDATTAWSFDATGFVRPGPLALYRPTMGLTDYEMQFLGMIDKKALSWVVRAADFNNFYVIKLVVLKDGPLPTVGVTRYAVVNGKADARVDNIAAIDAREDMLYRVRLDLHGDDFALTVQGQLVDAWSEPRLRHGGIGFFTARGEQSRVRWVQVTHQYDMLGRLCAYLAPYNNITPTSNGSWEQ